MKQLRIYLCCFLVVLLFLSLTACATPVTDPTMGTTTNTSTTATTAPKDHHLTITVCDTEYAGIGVAQIQTLQIWQAFEQLCEAKNLSIQWNIIPKADYDAYISQLLNGPAEQMPDAIWLGDQDTSLLTSAAENGAFTSLEEILVHSDGSAASLFSASTAFHRRNAVNNKLWWFGTHSPAASEPSGSADTGYPFGILVREDWLDALDMELPNTVQELENYLTACGQATGSQSHSYMTVPLNDITSGGLNGFFGVPSNHFAVNLQTGSVTCAWMAPGAKDLMRTYLEWLDKGYIPENLVGTTTGSGPYLRGNLSGIYFGGFNDSSFASQCEVPQGAPAAVYTGILPDLQTHPNGYILKNNIPAATNNMAFTANLQDKEAAAILMDLLVSPEWNELMRWGIEGKTYHVVDGEKCLYVSCSHSPIDYAMTAYEAAKTRPGSQLFPKGILPWILETAEPDLIGCGSELAEEQFSQGMQADTIYCMGQSPYLAIPTKEETALLTRYEEDYISLSQQIFASILRGEIDIDTQWESHVLKPLREAGMEELLSVYQARADRYFH